MPSITCPCGRTKEVSVSHFNAGAKYCSLACRGTYGPQPTTHGLSRRGRRHYLFETWVGIRKRCHLPTHQSYPRYGGRGISLHDAWRNDAGAFADWILSNLGERPPGATLDRIDNDGDYAPGNLRWATAQMQADNAHRKAPPASTGVPGVTAVHTRRGVRYRARTTKDQKTVYVGTFNTVDQAIEAKAKFDSNVLALVDSII